MKSKDLLALLLSLSAAQCLYIDEDCLIFPVYPVQYEVTLTPYMTGDQFYYEGEITIVAISTVNGQTTIELDGRDLQIHQNTVAVRVDNRDIVDKSRPVYVDQRRGKVIIYLREGLRAYNGLNSKGTQGYGKSQYFIRMRFRGNINSGDSGLFAKSYREGNTVKWLLSTRLAPNMASTVFPCFDNPRMEAGFIVKVYKPTSPQTILAVSREVRRQNASSYTLVEFAPSPQIPAYKLGLHLSEFVPHNLPPANPRADYLVVWTRREETQHHYFLQNFGNRILTALISYTNSSRPVVGGPINVVTIPKYWRSYEKGAWNLLTVGESKFLIDDELVSCTQRENMEFELTRQLCRIWLGNPDDVSKTRWKQEWFKEGMATYFGHYFMAWRDIYQRDSEAFGLQTLFSAMAIDTQNRPLSSYNITSADALKKEDENLITLKTAAILRMIEHWLKTEVFHKAVKDYLNANQGKTISIQDFGDLLQREAVHCEFFKGYTVSNVISSWVNRPGYPVVNVKIYRDNNVVALSQHHFDLRSQHTTPSDFIIPISFTNQFTENCLNCLQPRFIIAGSEYTFKENLNDGWIILNNKASGYYRVNYDEENWELIAKTLNGVDRKTIDVANRAQIVNDAFALHASGLLSLDLTTKILSTLQHEDELVVWEAAIQGYELMKRGQSMTRQFYDFWKKFLSRQVSTIYYKLSTNSQTDYQTRLFKSKITSFACSVDLPDCIKDMRNLRLGAKGRVMDPDLREAHYCVLMKQDNGWYELKRHLEACSEYEQEDILNCRNKADDEKALYKSLPDDPQKITLPTDLPPVVTECCTGPECYTTTPLNGASVTYVTSYLVVLGATVTLLLFRSIYFLLLIF